MKAAYIELGYEGKKISGAELRTAIKAVRDKVGRELTKDSQTQLVTWLRKGEAAVSLRGRRQTKNASQVEKLNAEIAILKAENTRLIEDLVSAEAGEAEADSERAQMVTLTVSTFAACKMFHEIFRRNKLTMTKSMKEMFEDETEIPKIVEKLDTVLGKRKQR